MRRDGRGTCDAQPKKSAFELLREVRGLETALLSGSEADWERLLCEPGDLVGCQPVHRRAVMPLLRARAVPKPPRERDLAKYARSPARLARMTPAPPRQLSTW